MSEPSDEYLIWNRLQMEAYDTLPPEIREAIYNARTFVNAINIVTLLDNGTPSQQIITAIKNGP